MGNSISNQTEPKNIKSLSQTIDDIAIHYILKQNVIDLLRLTDKEYYDNLIILIGKVFDTRLTNLEIGVLSGRINETIQDAIFSLLPATDNIKNKMISNISKFYIKIMMIYSAIVATIDPQYSYEDEQGQTQFFYLKDLSSLKKLPKETNPVLHQLTNPMNLCRKRITILKNKLETNEDDFIILNPGDKLCSIDSATKLTDEVGIKELDLLYYDIFDYSNKSWKKRSKEMEEKYKKDLVLFYQIFTGNENMPNEIKSFKDIELLDFKNLDYCNDPLFKEDFTVSKNDKLIMDYINQINIIEEEVKGYRTKLTEILKEIFLIKMVEDEQTYGINPTLTMPQILKLEENTRDTIINLYTHCERNFIKALLIFEEIYDIKSKDSQQNRYNNIEQGIVGTGLNTNSFSNFDTPVPPTYNKEPLFKTTMNITSLPENSPNLFASNNNSRNPLPNSMPQSMPDSLPETIPDSLPDSLPQSTNSIPQSTNSIPQSTNTIPQSTNATNSIPQSTNANISNTTNSSPQSTNANISNTTNSMPQSTNSSVPNVTKPLPNTTNPLPEAQKQETTLTPTTPNFWQKLTNFTLSPSPNPDVKPVVTDETVKTDEPKPDETVKPDVTDETVKPDEPVKTDEPVKPVMPSFFQSAEPTETVNPVQPIAK